jgi:hypothetical protein
MDEGIVRHLLDPRPPGSDMHQVGWAGSARAALAAQLLAAHGPVLAARASHS